MFQYTATLSKWDMRYIFIYEKNESVTLTILDFLRFFEDTFQRNLFVTREKVIFTNSTD